MSHFLLQFQCWARIFYRDSLLDSFCIKKLLLSRIITRLKLHETVVEFIGYTIFHRLIYQVYKQLKFYQFFSTRILVLAYSSTRRFFQLSVSVLGSSVWGLFGARGRPFTLLLHPGRLLVFVEVPPTCSTFLQRANRPKMGMPNRGYRSCDPRSFPKALYFGFEIKR